MHKNNITRRNRRAEHRLGETVRIASIVQKGMKTGRSSYVEMRSLERLTYHNIRTKVETIVSGEAGQDGDIAETLSKVLSAVHGGYGDVLTPNGVVRETELDRLLSVDSDIVTCIAALDSGLGSRSNKTQVIETLNELVEERKKVVGSLKA
ncbi:MAG: hypothetical protein ACREA4_04840 [Nitrososphaera sp.]